MSSLDWVDRLTVSSTHYHCQLMPPFRRASSRRAPCPARPQRPLRCATVALLLLGLACASAAGPAGGADSSTAAKALFEKGRVALTKSDYDEACAQFEMSQKLEPSVGTLLNLGLCNEMRGRLAQSLAYWREAERLAVERNDDRLDLARGRAAQVDPRVPVLTIELASDAPAETTVTWSEEIDEKVHRLQTRNLGTPVRVNVGTLTVRAEAPGYAQQSYELRLAERDRKNLQVSPGMKLPDGSAGGDEGSSGPGWRTAGFITGGVGLVGLTLGAIFGGVAAMKDGESREDGADGLPRCDDQNACTDEGLELRDEAFTAAAVSSVGFIAGGTLLAAGIVMIVAAPADEQGTDDAGTGATAAVWLGPGGASLRVRW